VELIHQLAGFLVKELTPMHDKRPDKEAKQREEDLDKKLDEQLEETFPTSDPPSLSQPTPNKPAGPKAGKR
jgi:hypothetical protein